MGSKKLNYSFVAISGLFSCMQLSAFELDKSQSSLALVEQGCAYGRGSMAIEGAKADALNNLRMFLKGQTSLSLSSDDLKLLDSQFDQTTRNALVSGIDQGLIAANFDQPELMGDDTCINVRVTSASFDKSQDNDSITWDSEPTVSVVVTGEGVSNKKRGLTARQVAEQDAFRRAISQVLGVMVKSGYLQQSYSNMSADSVNDDFNLQEVTRQSLSMQSQGMISGWNEVSSQTKSNGTLVLTLDVTVERQKLEDNIQRLIKDLGQPAVYVNAHLPTVKATFNKALADMGFDLSSKPEQATIILDVQETQKQTPSGMQLKLLATMQDRFGNQYGQWENDPSLISLPKTKEMLNELAAVHLALESNQQKINHILHRAVQKIATRGGPVRELIFSKSAAGKQGQLYTLLSAINGVSDVKIENHASKVIVNLRSLNNANDLAQYIEPTLHIHQPNHQSKLHVLNDYQISIF